MRRRVALLALAAGLVAVSCGGGTETADPDAAPIHDVPDGSVVVWGTAVCDGSGDAGVDPDGGAGWLMWCDLDLSDPRVSGSETQDRFRYMAGRLWEGGVWVAEDAAITNGGGTWRGKAQGAEDDEAVPIGEAHYIGEGAYRGLEFHCYFFDSPLHEEVQIHGWITGGE